MAPAVLRQLRVRCLSPTAAAAALRPGLVSAMESRPGVASSTESGPGVHASGRKAGKPVRPAIVQLGVSLVGRQVLLQGGFDLRVLLLCTWG